MSWSPNVTKPAAGRGLRSSNRSSSRRRPRPRQRRSPGRQSARPSIWRIRICPRPMSAEVTRSRLHGAHRHGSDDRRVPECAGLRAARPRPPSPQPLAPRRSLARGRSVEIWDQCASKRVCRSSNASRRWWTRARAPGDGWRAWPPGLDRGFGGGACPMAACPGAEFGQRAEPKGAAARVAWRSPRPRSGSVDGTRGWAPGWARGLARSWEWPC